MNVWNLARCCTKAVSSLRFLAAGFCATLACAAALAGPGAHGPGGEHLDQATATSGVNAMRPRVEAATELFELVAHLGGGELSMMIDRFNTNEPVLDARVQVESGGLKADAKFHADHGDFSIEDAKLIALLSKPGEHALVISVVAGNDSDLLNGTLVVKAASTGAAGAAMQGHGHDHHAWERWAWMGAAAAALALIMGYAWRRRTLNTARSGRLSMITGLIMLPVALMCAGGMLAPSAHAGPGAHGPGGEHLDAPGGAAGAGGLARLPDGSVNVPKAAQRRMAVRTVVAVLTEAAATAELPGRVIADPNASGLVQAVHGGRIEAGPKGLPVMGQTVRRGEVLAYVRHHAEPYAAGNQQAQLSELRTQRQLAEQRVRRLEELEGTVPRKDIEAARASAASLAERERSIGNSLSIREALAAPVSGVISRVDLVAGRVVEPRDVLIEVMDPARVLVEAVTADAGLASRVASARLSGVEAAQLKLIGAARSLRDGMLPLIFSVAVVKAGAALPLAVGQPVTVVVVFNERTKGYVLPAQAVARNAANEPVVWIKSGAERFIPQPVQFKPLDATTVVITQGLGADNRVVVQGASLISQIR